VEGTPAQSTTFGSYLPNDRSQRSWAASLTASSAIYVGLAVAVLALGSAQKVVREKIVDLKFVEKVVQEPPPPPPPVVEVKPEPMPMAAAPVIPPGMKIRKLDKPPPPKEMLAPKEMPTEAPREADPSEDRGIAVYGEPGKGDPAGLEGGAAGGQNAVALPEDADPPMPVAGNSVPPYPQEARATGKVGTVVLKVVILANGTVAQVQVMRGEEPFVTAAVQTVKTWKYAPARYKGQAITVYRIIQIPFKLTA
jgi:periplasmic protein TonB